MLNTEHSTLYDDTTHIQIQFPHRGRRSLKGFAKEGWVIFYRLFFLFKNRCLRQIGQNTTTHLLHSIKQSLSFQGFARVDLNGNRGSKLLLKLTGNSRNCFQQCILAIGL